MIISDWSSFGLARCRDDLQSYCSLTLQALEGFVLQGAGSQAPFDREVTGADGHRHRRCLLLQREVQPVEENTGDKSCLIHHGECQKDNILFQFSCKVMDEKTRYLPAHTAALFHRVWPICRCGGPIVIFSAKAWEISTLQLFQTSADLCVSICRHADRTFDSASGRGDLGIAWCGCSDSFRWISACLLDRALHGNLLWCDVLQICMLDGSSEAGKGHLAFTLRWSGLILTWSGPNLSCYTSCLHS